MARHSLAVKAQTKSFANPTDKLWHTIPKIFQNICDKNPQTFGRIAGNFEYFSYENIAFLFQNSNVDSTFWNKFEMILYFFPNVLWEKHMEFRNLIVSREVLCTPISLNHKNV